MPKGRGSPWEQDSLGGYTCCELSCEGEGVRPQDEEGEGGEHGAYARLCAAHLRRCSGEQHGQGQAAEVAYSDLNFSPPPPPRIIACMKVKNRSAYSAGGTGLILCYELPSASVAHINRNTGETHNVSRQSFPTMLHLFESVVWC